MDNYRANKKASIPASGFAKMDAIVRSCRAGIGPQRCARSRVKRIRHRRRQQASYQRHRARRRTRFLQKIRLVRMAPRQTENRVAPLQCAIPAIAL